MFPQYGPQSGGGLLGMQPGNSYPTIPAVSQNVGLLGNSASYTPPQTPDFNTTAPMSSNAQPAVQHIISALKGK